MGEPIGKLVQEITNQLTEGVSKFTLFVVTKKERAEAIPPNLSNGVDVVGNQCQTLVQLARELAGEYSDFPHIEASILSECSGLESSARNLTTTCRGMTSSNKQELVISWQRLASACGSIAEAVIKLMEILFQAELDRIYESAERVKAKCNDSNAFSSSQIAGDDYQLFADSASNAASEATQLAEYLTAKAEAEESPILRNQLLDHARSLYSNANSMIETANKCIDQNGDAKLLSDYHSFSNEVKKQAEDAIKKIKDAEKFKKQRQSSMQSNINSNNNNNNDNQRSNNSPPIVNNNRGNNNNNNRGGGRGAPSPRGGQRGSQIRDTSIPKDWKPQNMDQVSNAMRDVAKENEGKNNIGGCSGELALEIERLAEAAKRGAGSELLAAARNIGAITERFTNSVKQTALNDVKQPFYQDKLFQCSGSLNDFCRQLKIMASVKASICDSNSNLDKDEQLISLTTNLVRMWQETGHTLNVVTLFK